MGCPSSSADGRPNRLLGRAVHGAHVAVAIEGDDGVEGGVEHGPHALGVPPRDLQLALRQPGLVLAAPEPEGRCAQQQQGEVERQQPVDRDPHALRELGAVGLPDDPPAQVGQVARHHRLGLPGPVGQHDVDSTPSTAMAAARAQRDDSCTRSPTFSPDPAGGDVRYWTCVPCLRTR